MNNLIKENAELRRSIIHLHKELDDRLFKELMDNPYTANKVELQQEKVKKMHTGQSKRTSIWIDL